ncbi:MAG: hypothetical protein WDZ85_00040 [Candidatus Paceibacterota bacterium]
MNEDQNNNIVKQYLPTYRRNFEHDSRWLTRETTHYIFHYFPDSVAEREIEMIEKRQEEAFAKIITFLKILEPEKKITYYLYPDAKIKKELMGDDWYAQAIYQDFVVHLLYTETDKPLGEHEDTHLLSLPWGLSIDLFQEGLAEYLVGHGWHGENHDDLVRDGLSRDIFPNIEELLEHKKWLELDDANALYNYALVASFTKFLIENYGRDKFEQIYRQTNRKKTKEENKIIFFDTYRAPIEEIEKDWQKCLEN